MKKKIFFAALAFVTGFSQLAFANESCFVPSCDTNSNHSITVNNNGGYVYRYATLAEALGYGALYQYGNVMGDTVFSDSEENSLILRIASCYPLYCDRFHVDGSRCRLTEITIDGEPLNLNATISTDDYSLEYSDMWSWILGTRLYTLVVKFDSEHTVNIAFGPYFDDNECLSMQHYTISNVTNTTADLNWLAGSGTHTYYVSYGLYENFDTENGDFSGPHETGSITSYDTIIGYSLSGLQPGTHYVARIQMNCDNGGGWYWWNEFTTSGTAFIDPSDPISGAASAKIYQRNNQVVVEGADGNAVSIYDAEGRQLAVRRNEGGSIRFDVPATGAYFVKIGSAPARRIVVVK